MKKTMETYILSFIYGIYHMDSMGRLVRVPDSSIKNDEHNRLLTTGDYDIDCKRGVYVYRPDGYNKDNSAKYTMKPEYRMPLSDVDTTKYMLKYTSGTGWMIRETPHKTYETTHVYDRDFVLGKKLKIKEKDDFHFTYYDAYSFRYDPFGVLIPTFWATPEYVAECKTVKGVMHRYGHTREQARAFLRGAIMDTFAPDIASVVLTANKQQKR